MPQIVGHYWPFSFDRWLGGPPEGWDATAIHRHLNCVIPDEWHEVVLDRSLQAGPRIVAERYGRVLYHFAAWAPGAAISDGTTGMESQVGIVMRRLRVMNVFLLLTHIAYLELDGVPSETARLSHFDLVNVGEDLISMGGPGLKRLPTTIQFDDLFRGTTAIPSSVLDRSAQMLDTVLLSDSTDLLSQLDLLHLGLAMFQQHDYAQTLLAAWTVCEQIVSARWATFIAERHREIVNSDGTTTQRINSDRSKLLRGPEYPISTVLEILELGDALDHESFQKLHQIRKQRNKWLHELREPDAIAAGTALTTAGALLGDGLGHPMQVSLNRSIQHAG